MTPTARDVTLALVAARAPAATVCPSEVARALAAATGPDNTAAGWRGMMSAVHAAFDRLVAEGAIQLSWKGKRLTARSGPYRIARGGRE